MDPTGLSLDGNEQPFNLRLGNAAHRAIQADYEDWAFIHNKDVVTEPYNSSFQNLIRPDLLNKSDFLVGEIKPFSVPSISAGYAKLIASKSLLNGQTAVYGGKSIPAPQSGPLLGKTSWDFETWAPGLKGFKVYLLPSIEEHLVVTLGNWKGLVVYKRFRQRKAETLHEFAARAEREAVRVVGVADVNSDGRLTGNEVDCS